MKEYLKKYFFLLGHQYSGFLTLITLFLLASGLDFLGIGLISPFAAALMPGQETHPALQSLNEFFPEWSFQYKITLLGGIIVLAFLVKGIFVQIVQRHIIRFSYARQEEIRIKLLKNYLALPLESLNRKNSSTILNTILQDTSIYTQHTLISSLRVVAEGLVLTGVTLILLFTSPVATLTISVLLGSIFLCYTFIFKNEIVRIGKEITASNQGIIKEATHSISGFKEIRVLGIQNFFISRLQKHSNKLRHASEKYDGLQLLPRNILEFMVVTFVICFAIISRFYLNQTENLLATLGVFTAASIRLIPSITLMTNGLNNLRRSKTNMETLYFDLMNVSGGEPISEVEEKVKNIPSFQDLVVRDLCFKYKDSSTLNIDHLNFDLRRGESLGIIGKSGSGKTTLVNTLLGFNTIQAGEIILNGTLKCHKFPHYLRTICAYIPQEGFIIDDTIARNIAIGQSDEEIDYAKIHKVIQMACLEEVVIKNEKGIHAVLGEKGNNLSGGQRQRVALARAFYYDKDVIIMDEATSALDNETEKSIVETINKLKGKTTLIVIAHRLTTIQNCTRIIEMNQGKINRQGSYQDIVLN